MRVQPHLVEGQAPQTTAQSAQARPEAQEERTESQEEGERQAPGQRGGGGRGGGPGGFGGGRPAPNGTYRVVLVVDGREQPPQLLRLDRDPNAPATAVLEAALGEVAMTAEEEEEEEEREARGEDRGRDIDDID